MTRQQPEQDYEYFTVVKSRQQPQPAGHTRTTLIVRDKFAGRRYGLGRVLVGTSARILTRYLHRRPHKRFDSRVNIARTFVYLSPSFRALYEYMPGGFVTYHAYDPDKKYLKDGQRLDPLARMFFRHASDGVGVRSRAYAMAWRVAERYRDASEVHWLSIACGVGQATFDAARLLPGDVTYTLIDMDGDALAAATTMAASYHIEPDRISTHQLNVVTDARRLVQLVRRTQPTVVDAMGLFEYLSPDDAAALLRRLYHELPAGGTIIFTNMLPSHPHLAIHRHGMGWPGVIVRDEPEVVQIVAAAGIPLASLTVLRPSDGVYAVYEVVK